MPNNFKLDVEEFVNVSRANMLLVVRQSLLDVIDDASTPKAKGGRMRVRTGFLRASGRSSLTGLPSGPRRGSADAENRFRNTGEATYEYSDAETIATVEGMEIGDTFYYGWAAVYAKYREPHDAFLEGALQKWPSIVRKNVEELKRQTQ